MAFSFLRRKRRRKKAKVRIKGAPAGHAAGKVSPRANAPARRPASAATPARRSTGSGGASRPRRKAAPLRRHSRKRALLGMAFRASIALFILGGVALMFFVATLPDIRDLDKISKKQGITVETPDGRIIATYGDVYGSYIPYDKFPKTLIEAVLATEDRRFFQHHGIDFWGITRAMVVNVTKGRMVQGGSTITQQVAKNVFLTPERSLTRKVREALLAFWLEGRYSKQEIMAIYLNRVYLGAGTFGVDAASRRYFNKPGTELDLVESAMIAGLLKAPSRYAPTASSERAMARAHQVLKNMADNGVLKEKAIIPALKAFAAKPTQAVAGSDVRYYTDWVVDAVPDYVGSAEEDLIVVTPFDPAMQAAAADAIENTLSMEGDAKRVSQGAIVLMQPDGAVKAMVGGKSYGESQYNRAAQAKRQPGSLFKLFVYLAALEAGYTPTAQVEDAPISIRVGNKTWTPRNYTGQYKGTMTVAQAFRESINTVAVRLSEYAGVRRVAQMAERLGIPDVYPNPSIALGAEEATLLEMTSAFAHLANGGSKVEPYGIVEIRTAKGRELYKRPPAESNPVLAQGTVEMMNYLMLGTVRAGTGTRAALPGRDVAGKTGTTSDYKDAWFVGFTPQLVGGVWLGNDNNRPMAKVTGGNLPAAIWHDAMIKALDGTKPEPIPNNAASNEGLLPWLFGGGNAEQPPAPVETPAQEVPVDSPFGYMNEGAEPTRMIPTPLPPGSQPVPVQQAPSGGNEGGDVLSEEFWNKLMDKVPSKDSMEYSYPSQ
ncbi:MAG: hypothetical protein DI582_06405 [Azospirillum brasilense]|nr:MAG: hypothetical protein DI582_06405 [Azospirillum brasilense]